MRRTALPLLLAALTTGACMGGDGGTARGLPGVECDGAAFSGATGLPARFPKPDAATYVRTEQRGPTRVVTGFYEGELDDAYEAYRDALDNAGYTILFDEIEDTDSEVTYEDPRSRSTGLVALKEQCEEDGRIAVRITNRPG